MKCKEFLEYVSDCQLLKDSVLLTQEMNTGSDRDSE